MRNHSGGLFLFLFLLPMSYLYYKNHPYYICSNCAFEGRKRIIFSHKRIEIFAKSGLRNEQVISVWRLQCPHCFKTHSLLPKHLLSHSSYSHQFIMTVLREYYSHKKTVRELCSHWQISCSTLYGWIHKYGNQL